jgi:hypothetical protein
MWFGKTFAAYQLALKTGWKKALVLTFKPVINKSRLVKKAKQKTSEFA